jgi:hypothetical protein
VNFSHIPKFEILGRDTDPLGKERRVAAHHSGVAAARRRLLVDGGLGGFLWHRGGGGSVRGGRNCIEVGCG